LCIIRGAKFLRHGIVPAKKPPITGFNFMLD
jgi:hypothetical protein